MWKLSHIKQRHKEKVVFSFPHFPLAISSLSYISVISLLQNLLLSHSWINMQICHKPLLDLLLFKWLVENKHALAEKLSCRVMHTGGPQFSLGNMLLGATKNKWKTCHPNLLLTCCFSVPWEPKSLLKDKPYCWCPVAWADDRGWRTRVQAPTLPWCWGCPLLVGAPTPAACTPGVCHCGTDLRALPRLYNQWKSAPAS